MKNKKRIIGIFAFLLVGISIYLMTSFDMLNRTEVYYGKFVQNNQTTNLYSHDNQYQMKLNKKRDKLQEGNWVKVTLTDQKGVIVDVKAIDKTQIPKSVLRKIERSQ
ncbi:MULTISPECIES: hypothetical protein [Staphylococcus]|uniref:YxeA family protein n=1 Tax=Staphylococcus schleiferi TaxID=1295 RepID=A0A7Z7QS57_STASC|nr:MULTISPECIES: hypothetical protein [Staphylococcus]QGS46600.1 hypothetical protein FOB90_07840 [Mammaliicoccus fleurettii]EPD49968.1 hypothetical protein HMPREF1208_01504 [Staphylococcus sp. HGB0015]MBF1992548.1 hypothetical protein [Staphylococcus schleiferi]MBF2039020.1 hypothetical protein [Staphylococcus schleiferi]MBF2100046.1 hypothetical protein [Staphylococcus schleiferi]